MKSMIRVMIVVATLFSMVATTIIPHHHHQDGETICSCHHISCCHEEDGECNHHENHSDCSDCLCNIKISIEQMNLLTKVPAPIQLPLLLDLDMAEWAEINSEVKLPHKKDKNYPPNLISPYIVYSEGIALRAPPQF